MEFVGRNLLEYISEKFPRGLQPDKVRRIVWQLVKAIEHCHQQSLIHRDIKPENILIRESDLFVKLCDFGFARSIPSIDEKVTDYVATRWYRSPELLLGSRSYGPEVDMFAIGCVLGELVDGQPLLPGRSDLDQLNLIHNLVGPLTIDQQKTIEITHRSSMVNVLPPGQRKLAARFRGKLNSSGMSLLRSLLEPNGANRITSTLALSHPYFDSMRSQSRGRRCASNESTCDSLILSKFKPYARTFHTASNIMKPPVVRPGYASLLAKR